VEPAERGIDVEDRVEGRDGTAMMLREQDKVGRAHDSQAFRGEGEFLPAERQEAPVRGEGVVVDLAEELEIAAEIPGRDPPDDVAVPRFGVGPLPIPAFEVLPDPGIPHGLEPGGDPIARAFEERGIRGGIVGLEEAWRRPEPVDLEAELGIMMGIERALEGRGALGEAIRFSGLEQSPDGFGVVRGFEKAESGRRPADPSLRRSRRRSSITTARRAAGVPSLRQRKRRRLAFAK
jgi:hypothetical protein